MTRRAVLAAGGLTAAASVLPAVPSWGAAPVGREAFEAARNSAVVLRTPAGKVRAVIRAVHDVAGVPSGSPAAYSVLVKPAVSVPDGIYRVSSARLGRTTLFFANVDRGRAAGLEAVVNTSRS